MRSHNHEEYELKRDPEILVACALLVLCCALACSSNTPTQLCDGFRSLEKPQEVRERLRRSRVIDHWSEETNKIETSDRRAPHNFLTMSGPFQLSEFDGTLKLTFYNSRLMTAEFSTRSGLEYLASLRQKHVPVSAEPRKEVDLDRHTTFRYDIDQDGIYRFNWTDARLQAEWLKWVRDNS